MWSRNIRFAPAEKRKEHIVSDEKNCKRSEKPVYFQNFRKMLYCTDNLIISGFIGVGTVGRYANYCMITQAISNILTILANTIQPTVGDYLQKKSSEKL